MPDINIQYIAGGLALFFITIAIYKALSQKASKRAAAARSLAQSHEGQELTVSFHDPFSNGAKPPATPDAAGEAHQATAPAIPKTHAVAPSGDQPQAAAASPEAQEQIYKWN
jgi:hypothetical protein